MYGARTPEGEVAFQANGRVDFERQRRVGKTKLLDDDEMDYYVDEYARHGLNGPLNWYRVREDNYMDEWKYFFDEGRKSRQDALRDLTFKQEILFVLATKDQTLKPFMAAKMGERIPNLTRREVDSGHWALWQRPEECNKIIGDWLHEKVFSPASGGGKSKL
jgi:soluble epoxide hydrolase/lipid-phosphate phosphatase